MGWAPTSRRDYPFGTFLRPLRYYFGWLTLKVSLKAFLAPIYTNFERGPRAEKRYFFQGCFLAANLSITRSSFISNKSSYFFHCFDIIIPFNVFYVNVYTCLDIRDESCKTILFSSLDELEILCFPFF